MRLVRVRQSGLVEDWLVVFSLGAAVRVCFGRFRSGALWYGSRGKFGFVAVCCVSARFVGVGS